MKLKPNFIALLTFLPASEGGRTTPVSSGYRPALRFPFALGQFTGIQDYMEIELVYPGDNVKAVVTMLDNDYFDGKLYKGLDFDFFEGDVEIGHGVITKILTPEDCIDLEDYE